MDAPQVLLEHYLKQLKLPTMLREYVKLAEQCAIAGRVTWTGPLYAIPEPPLALLVGHEIAYYASPRLKMTA